ncbi:exopolysaccharide production protein ExoQ [Pararhizobium capsulatum DSM 1112]|uniref:Exopolysaccharide production protein ExoQ n=1 Tax=Pararhizobium capsulatum DSM 1112 TaxID=1121113 RepID=A0ABU0BW75_9HYPH|nr:O-antigen ligase [Pararhizobium capsulatum]MDQ0322499.1 exopolysaccharide production protein ExoQ [Pararhizobium capsulatum DSM 1112]
MKIAKARLIEPGENNAYGIFAVAVSFFVFAYSARFGQVSILAYYGLWLPLIFLDYRRVLGDYNRNLWIFGFAVFACLSVFWSAAPSMTARTGIQYLTHVGCALIAVRVLDIRTLTCGAIAGTGVVLVYSMLFGVYHLDPLDGTVSFVGAFASKNQLGFYASLGVYFAFATVVTLRERRIWLVASGIVGMLACYALLASQSATSVLTTAAVVSAAIGMRVLLRLSPKHRKMVFIGGGVAFVAFIAAFISSGGTDLVLGAFGKDSTLTGRTYLWQQGMQAAADNPYFGVGYQAYWVQGFSQPERLWEEFFIGSRAGFHFHNTFIEAAVETGLIGLFLLCSILIITLFGQLKRFLARANDPEATVLFGVSVLLGMRAFVEIDIMNPYHVGSFLLYFAAGKLTLRRRSVSSPSWTDEARVHRVIYALPQAGR